MLTVHEQELCESPEIRSQYHFLCQKTFWNNTIDDCRKHLSELNRDHHLDVVMIGEGFTNSVWSHTSTLQYDVQKLWYYVQKYGRERYDSIVPDFGLIPIKHVTLDLLLMLPIKAVFGYLQYHGVDVARTTWQLLSTMDKVEQLPVGTQIPFGIWCNYLVVMLDYLHGLMNDEGEAYALMHNQYTVKVHFPDEGRLLRNTTDHLAVLRRATTFARSSKFKGEVYEKCSVKWVIFLYYIVSSVYPPISKTGVMDSEHCVRALASIPAHRDRMVLDIGRLFHGHQSRVSAMLQDHSLALRLYGTTGHNAPVGVQKLMAAGVAYMYFWMQNNSALKHKTANIDRILPTALLAYILSARGILAPVDGKPVFESDCVPIHQQATVYTSTATLIRTKEPCVLSLPPSVIRRGITDDDYRSHYEAPLKMDAVAPDRLMNRELADFHKSSRVERGLSTTTCLFPHEKLGAIKDVTVGNQQSYLVDAGRRLVMALQGKSQDPKLQGLSHHSSSSKANEKGSSPNMSPPPFSKILSPPASKGSALKQSFLVRKDGSVLLSKVPPTVDVVNMAELKRRVTEMRAKKAKTDQQNEAAKRGDSIATMRSRYQCDTHVVNIYDSYKDVQSMFSTDWTLLQDGFDGNQHYLEEIRFFDKADRPVQKGDKLIMLYDINHIMTSLFNCSHLLYTVYSVVGHSTYAYFTESLWSVGAAQVDGFFPSKIVVQIPGPYILFEESAPRTTPPEASTPNVNWGASSHPYDIDDEDTSSFERNERNQANDAGSEDSDARRIAKTSSIHMGRMTFKVVGKTTIRDDLQKGIAICNIMEEGRMDILLAPLGVYGHTVTATNIIAGLFRHRMDDSDFMVENMNVPRKRNKALVQTQAWTPYKNLFPNMAFQQYQLAANMTEDSIRSIHFVQLKLAIERNYMLQTGSCTLKVTSNSFKNCTDRRTVRFSRQSSSTYRVNIWGKPIV
jgi:hypothetical protein